LFLSLVHGVRSKGKLTVLDESNWRQVLHGEWMIEFFAPWCPACKTLQPIWEEFAAWSDDLEIKIGTVDVTENPGLSGRFLVTALPTIFHVKNGEFRMYRGGRAKDEFMSFIEEEKWNSVETISGWKSPDSFIMSLVSYFFKLSMFMRSVHTSMIEDYGVPYWASYILFALATILIGAVLGLILVCFIDCIYPPKTGDFTDSQNEKIDNLLQEGIPDDADVIDDDTGTDKSELNDENRKGLTSDEGTQSESCDTEDESYTEEEDVPSESGEGSPKQKELRKRTAVRAKE